MVSPETFPLPTLGPRLRQVRHDVYEGKGFGVIRGIDAQKYPVEDLTMIYLGVQSYVSSLQGRQDKRGNMLGMWQTMHLLAFENGESLTMSVHIVADDSTKLKAEHHRHSTSSIVSFSTYAHCDQRVC
jgi:hypothetical protein